LIHLLELRTRLSTPGQHVDCTNPFVAALEMCGGVDKIEDLHQHESHQIYHTAFNILEKKWAPERRRSLRRRKKKERESLRESALLGTIHNGGFSLRTSGYARGPRTSEHILTHKQQTHNHAASAGVSTAV
jgi:hypothetical protein